LPAASKPATAQAPLTLKAALPSTMGFLAGTPATIDGGTFESTPRPFFLSS